MIALKGLLLKVIELLLIAANFEARFAEAKSVRNMHLLSKTSLEHESVLNWEKHKKNVV